MYCRGISIYGTNDKWYWENGTNLDSIIKNDMQAGMNNWTTGIFVFCQFMDAFI